MYIIGLRTTIKCSVSKPLVTLMIQNIYGNFVLRRIKSKRFNVCVILSLILIGFLGSYAFALTSGGHSNSPSFVDYHHNKNKRIDYGYPSFSTSAISISGTGYSFPVYLNALQTSFIVSNLQNDFSVDLNGLTSYKSVLNFTHIQAENYTMIIENYIADGNTDLANSPSASFTVPADCFLRYVNVDVTGVSGITTYVRIYNSTWSSSKGRSELDTSIYEQQVDSSTLIDGYVEMNDFYLNTSSTDNNTFFLVFFVSALDAGKVYWNYVDDTTNGDNSTSYYFPSVNPQYQTVDYIFNVSIAFAKDPTPANLSLSVNSTQVLDNYTWYSPKFFSTPQIYFNVSAIWPFVNYNVTYYIYENQTLTSDSKYFISSGETSVTWTVNFTTSLSQVFTSLNATLYPPNDWVFGYAKNGSLLYPYVETSTGYVRVYWNRGNGDWWLYFTSPNYFSAFYVSPNNALITQNISFSAAFISIVSATPQGFIDIYYETGTTSTLVKTLSQSPNQNWLNTSWIPSNDVDLVGNFSAYVRWSNGTEAGLAQSNFYLKYPTLLLSLFNESKEYLISDIIEVRVYYTEIYHSPSQPIEEANVTGSWIYNNSVKFIDSGNGYYTAYLSTDGAKNGTYTLNVTAVKFGYQEQVISLNITLIYKTRLESYNYIANYTIPVTIHVNYLFDNGTPIIGASVFINGTKMTDNFNGTYSYVARFTSLGVYYYVINASKPGYQSQNTTISVTVTNISTYIEGQSIVSLEYVSSATVSVTYKMFNGTLIPFANAKLYINGTQYSIRELSPGVYGALIQQNFTVGTYDLEFYLEKYGFAPSTFHTILKVLPASTFASTVDGNFTYSVLYHKQLTIGVNFTLSSNSSIISDATAYAIPSYNLSKMFIPFEVTPTGYYNFSIYIEHPKNFTLYVYLEHWQYENQTLVITVIVIPRNVSYTLSAPLESPAGMEFNVSFHLEDQITGEPITNASLTILISGNNSLVETKIYVVADSYIISVVVNNKPSTNTTVTLSIFTYLPGFKNATGNFSVYVYSIKTNTSISYPARVPYGENISVIINYGVANAKIVTNWSFFELTDFNNGTYSILFNTSTLSFGGYSILIVLFKENYVNFSTTITFAITKLPTEIIADYENVVLWNDPLTLNITLLDVFHQRYLDNFTVYFNFTKSYQLTNSTTYVIIRIPTEALSPGRYAILINASRENAENASLVISFTVSPRYAKIIFPNEIHYYVNNTLTFNVSLIDSNSSEPIRNATLTLLLFNETYQFTELSDGLYQTKIYLPTPGSFNGTILFTKENYYQASHIFTLTVLKRSSVIFYISIIGNPIAGSSVGINVTAIYDNGSVASNIPLVVEVSFTLDNGSVVTINNTILTNEQGQAIFDIDIPSNTQSMSVTVYHYGLISTVSSEGSKSFTVTKPFSILDYWWSLALLFVVFASVYSVYKVRRKRVAVKLTEQIKTKELYAELASIQHYLLIHNSGVLMFYRNYVPKALKADLLSGLITALTTVSSQVLETSEKSKYSVHTYSGLVITVIHGNYVMAAFISEKPLSSKMINRAYYLLKILERRYKEALTKWGGDLDAIKPFALSFEQELAIPLVHLEMEPLSLKGKYSSLSVKMKQLYEREKKLTIADLVKVLDEREISLLHELLIKKKIKFKMSEKR